MRMVDIIAQKRNGGVLDTTQLQFFVDGIVTGSIPDYQISALLMAIYFKGMTDAEQTQLTMKMTASGHQLDLQQIPGIKVDKHSTGGVGDKVSLPLAAMVAATGIPVPMISGRGLGHTGGTLDKLEAIPGYQTDLSEAAFIQQVATEHLAIIGATKTIAPADKRLYALRDVTATVDSIPLIASSIMSKKIASGTDALVIDVKTGSGAFMKTLPEAEKLAKALVAIGQGAGLACVAVITDMDQPLGYQIGNALEVQESIDLLKNRGPADLKELVLTLGSHMVVLGQKAPTLAAGRALLESVCADGSALDRFKALIKAQGGDSRVVDQPEIMPQAKYQIDYVVPRSGVVTHMAADQLGIASMLLGGGRQKAGDVLDLGVGLTLHKKVGARVQANEPLVTIHSDRADVGDILDLLAQSIQIADIGTPNSLVYKVITSV